MCRIMRLLRIIDKQTKQQNNQTPSLPALVCKLHVTPASSEITLQFQVAVSLCSLNWPCEMQQLLSPQHRFSLVMKEGFSMNPRANKALKFHYNTIASWSSAPSFCFANANLTCVLTKLFAICFFHWPSWNEHKMF